MGDLNPETKIIFLLRSVPGGGKSRLAKELRQETGVICSADDYFMDEGVYKFDPDKLGNAHGYCRWLFLKSLENGISPIIIDNTNIVWRDIKEYVEYGAIADYTIFLAEPQTPWRFNTEECFKKNTHGVLLEIIQKMLAKYQPNQYIVEMALKQFGVEIRCLGENPSKS